MATFNAELLILQANLINIYTKARINAGRTGNMPKYNAIKALSPDVNKAMFSTDINFVQSVYEKIMAQI